MHEPGRQQPREEEPNFSLGRTTRRTRGEKGIDRHTDDATMQSMEPRTRSSRTPALTKQSQQIGKREQSRSRPPRRDRQCRIPWSWTMVRLPNAHAHTGQREVGCEAGWSRASCWVGEEKSEDRKGGERRHWTLLHDATGAVAGASRTQFQGGARETSKSRSLSGCDGARCLGA